MDNLKQIYLFGNVCINDTYNSSYKLENFKRDVKNNCKFDENLVSSASVPEDVVVNDNCDEKFRIFEDFMKSILERENLYLEATNKIANLELELKATKASKLETSSSDAKNKIAQEKLNLQAAHV